MKFIYSRVIRCRACLGRVHLRARERDGKGMIWVCRCGQEFHGKHYQIQKAKDQKAAAKWWEEQAA